MFKPDYLVVLVVVVVVALAFTTLAYPLLVTYVEGLNPEVECMINDGCYVANAMDYPGALVYDASGYYLGKLTESKCIPRKGTAVVSGKTVLRCEELVLEDGEVRGIEAVEVN